MSRRKGGERDVMSVKHSGTVQCVAYLQPATKQHSATCAEVKELSMDKRDNCQLL